MLPSRSGWSPAAKRILVHFRHKFAIILHPFDCLISVFRLLSVERMFPLYIYICIIRCPGRKKIFRAHNLPSVGDCKFFFQFVFDELPFHVLYGYIVFADFV